MTIKDYKCKCGCISFFVERKGNQTGIYCSNCGKWLKWADKDEQNLKMNQYPKDIDDVLDKISAEIKSMDFDFGDFYDHTDQIIEKVCEVIDKYREVET